MPDRHAREDLDERGRARMVDLGGKPVSERRAVARATIALSPAVARRLREHALPKGEALAVARIAGIQAAKQTPALIPLCHPISLSNIEIAFEFLGENTLQLEARACAHARTGTEMEAMTAAAIAALTIYDMCKGLDRGLAIRELALVEKSGGKSGTWRRGKP